MNLSLFRFFRAPASLALAGRGVQYATQFGLVLIVPKVMVPEAYVQFSLVMPLAFLGMTLVYGWLAGSMFRHVHELLAASDTRFRQTVTFYYGVTAISLVLGYLVTSFYVDSIYHLVPMILLAAALKAGILRILNGAERYRFFLVANLGFAVSLVIFLLMCWRGRQEDIAQFLLIYALIDIVLGLAFWKLAGVFVFSPRPKFDKAVVKRYLHYGIPLVMNNIAVWVVSMSDRYMLSFWETPTRVADYILSYQLGGSVITIPMAFVMAVVFPKAIRLDRDEGQDAALKYIYAVLGLYLRYITLILILACAIVIPFKFYFYPEYEFNPLIIIIIVLAHVIYGLSQFYNKEFELDGRTLVITRGIGLGGGLNIALNLLLIPVWGGVGAAMATLIAYCVSVYYVRSARSHKFSIT